MDQHTNVWRRNPMRLLISKRTFRRGAVGVLATLVVLAMVVSAALGAAKAKAPAAKAPVLNYAKYVGGKGKANESLSPVVIGWVNAQGNTQPGTSFPSTTRGVE